MRFVYAILQTLFVLLFLAGIVALNYSNYAECRAHGFSRLYCVSRH